VVFGDKEDDKTTVEVYSDAKIGEVLEKFHEQQPNKKNIRL